MSVNAHIANAVRQYAGRTALIEGSRRWTFAELGQTVEKLAGALQLRITPGSRVGLFMRNRAEYLILQLAIERAGLVRVPLNMRYTAYEVERIVEDCAMSAVFFDEATAGKTAALAASGLWLCAVDGDAENGPTWSQAMNFDGPAAVAVEDYDALASINYTSGSSGRPKGVMLSHRNWLSVYRNMLIDRDIRGDDRLAHIGPLTHASGTYFTPFLSRGAASIIVPGGLLEDLLPTIEAEKVTAFSCVPTVLARILNDPTVDRRDLSSLRWISYGAEAIQRNTLDRALARWGDKLTHNYGLTEAMMTCTFLKASDHRFRSGELAGQPRFGCVGRPYSFVDIVLRDQDGEEVEPGAVGEITIRAEHVMVGYWKQPAESAKALRGGWLWTGDLARRDADGFIYIVGRSKEMLISGGFNIYPAEVEACLSSCPGVEEAAVIGIPDDSLGELCVAFVAAEPSATLTAAICENYCKPKIGIRTPRKWVFVSGLPRTGNGKVDKAELRSRLVTAEAAQ